MTKWLKVRVTGDTAEAVIGCQSVLKDSDGVEHAVTHNHSVEIPVEIYAELRKILDATDHAKQHQRAITRHMAAVEDGIEKRPLLEKAKLALTKTDDKG